MPRNLPVLTMDLWRLNNGLEIYIEQWDNYFYLDPITEPKFSDGSFVNVIQDGFVIPPIRYSLLPVVQDVAPGDLWRISPPDPAPKRPRYVHVDVSACEMYRQKFGKEPPRHWGDSDIAYYLMTGDGGNRGH